LNLAAPPIKFSKMSKTKEIIKKYPNGYVLLLKKGGYYNISKNHMLLGEWTMSLDKAEQYLDKKVSNG
jgi:hypothetical protein